MIDIPQEYLDLVPKEITDDDEAFNIARLVNRNMLDKKFGAEYVQSVFDRCAGTGQSPQIAISREKNAEQDMYDIHAGCVFITASLIAPNFLMTLEMDGDASGVISAAKILEAADSDAYMFFYSMVPRPGWGEFTADLEYNHYTPGTPNNEKLKSFWTVIPPRHKQPVWLNIIGIPKSDEHLAEAAAITAGLKPSASDVAATIMSHEGVFSCPLVGKNIYAMSNLSGHPVYDNKNFNELCKQDTQAARAIAKEHGFDRHTEQSGEDKGQVQA